MNVKLSQSFWIGFLALVVLSPSALATPEEDVASAQEALSHEEVDTADKFLRKAAEQNYAPAQVGLGDLMHSTQEYDEAVGWYLMAAYQGDAAAAFNLGQMYAVGESVEQNSAKALYWVKLAAEKNYLLAVDVLATAYQNGDLGVKVDPDQAKIWADRIPPLRAAANKIVAARMAKLRAEKKAQYEAAVKKFGEDKAAAEKTALEEANKAADAADENIEKKPAEQTQSPPSK